MMSMPGLTRQRALAPAARAGGVGARSAVLALLLVSAGAWALSRQRMAGMDAGPGTDPGGVGPYALTWLMMMTAMMLPAGAPMLNALALMQRRRDAPRFARATAARVAFVAGYLFVWAVFGLAAYGLYRAARALPLGVFSWRRGGPYLAGGVLLAAAVYQLSPAKHACLRRCRDSVGFLRDSWRAGGLGALRMGAEHGAWCVGCCWALMLSLFALGLMSLTWMIVISAAVAVERLLPRAALTRRLVAAALLVLALGVALVPRHVPELTIPTSAAATRAMRAMGAGTMHMHMPAASTAGAMAHLRTARP
jgi:predicted metal-binding membrane protein